MQPYRSRLKSLTDRRGALCVGVDPHPHLLKTWGLPHSVDGLERCARGLVEAIGDQVAVFKPQSAFFESWGAAGIAVLERVLADIHAAGALSILDAKRGDIGSTMEAYAQAYLADGAPLASDAVTLNPFLGVGSLDPAIDMAHQTGRGIYLLCRTSNEHGIDVQGAQREQGSVAQYVVDSACAYNDRSGQHALGLVIGATSTGLDVKLDAFKGSILVPGIGAQGGSVNDLPRLFGAKLGLALPTSSRQIMFAGPDKENLRSVVAETLGHLR